MSHHERSRTSQEVVPYVTIINCVTCHDIFPHCVLPVFVHRRGPFFLPAWCAVCCGAADPSPPLPSRPVHGRGGAGRGGVSDLNLFTATAAEPGDITDPPTLARPAPGGQQPYIAAGCGEVVYKNGTGRRTERPLAAWRRARSRDGGGGRVQVWPGWVGGDRCWHGARR